MGVIFYPFCLEMQNKHVRMLFLLLSFFEVALALQLLYTIDAHFTPDER
jgi:phage shock protein PspC (stress-responsive transcriptional regulator)